MIDSRGHSVKIGASALAPNHKQLVAPISGQLSPGSYKVSWKAVSTDTHRVQGAYSFTVPK